MNQKAIIGFINIFIIIAIILYFSREFFTYKGPDIDIHIRKGMGITEIAQLLEKKGVVPNAKIFLIYVQSKGADLKYGYYTIKHGYTLYDIWKMLHEGREKLFKFIIKPGDNLIIIGERLEKDGFIKDKLDFYKFVFDDRKVFKYGLEGITFEGYLPPETYYLSKTKSNESVKYLVDTFVNYFKKEYLPYKNKVDHRFRDLGLDFYDVMIIASMVEKETSVPTEKPLIAGVIMERLRINMILQIDPTRDYSKMLKKLIDQYPDVFKHYAIYYKWEEYDTYKYKGLPPTPICSFTTDTLEATLNFSNPQKYLYYFSPRGRKDHLFSRTYEQHLRYIRQYRNRR
jgi:UPF0755 protein